MFDFVFVCAAGVNLYSRKVLIENKPADLLPNWLRFLKGVVDSEDLPLSIAREKAQDSLLLKKIRDVITRKVSFVCVVCEGDGRCCCY